MCRSKIQCLFFSFLNFWGLIFILVLSSRAPKSKCSEIKKGGNIFLVVGFIFYSHSNINIIMVLNESLFSLIFSSTFKVLSFLLAHFP
jgi:hypothetical protein